MTFLSRIQQLQLRAVAADDEGKIMNRIGDFTALRERLEKATTSAVRVDIGRKELHSAGILPAGHEENQNAALAGVMDLIAVIETLSVEAKFDAVKMQGSLIEAHFKASEKLVSDAWRSHLPLAAPAVDDELLDALEQGGVDVETIRSDIEDAKAALLMLRNRPLPETGDSSRLQKALDTLNSSGRRIGELIDPEIADLVVRAQGGGVLYSEMTTEVILALTKLGIFDRLRVVLK